MRERYTYTGDQIEIILQQNSCAGSARGSWCVRHNAPWHDADYCTRVPEILPVAHQLRREAQEARAELVDTLLDF